MAAFRRRLSFSEVGFTHAPVTTAVVQVSLRGVLEVDALRAAFAALRRERPVLAGRLEMTDAGTDLVIDAMPAPAELFLGVREFVPDSAELELFSPVLDLTKSMSAVEVATDGDQHRIALGVNHAVADGTHVIDSALRLWQLYTAIAEGDSATELPETSPPCSPQELLAARGIERGDTTGQERLVGTTWSGADPDQLPPAPELMLARQLFSPTTSAGFRAAAKSHGMSVHALISGIITAAECEAVADGSARLGVMSLVDGRSRFTPAVAPGAVTNLVGASYAAVEVDKAADPIMIGTIIHDQLREDLASGQFLQPMLHEASVDAEPPVVISNLGVVPDLRLPPGLVQAEFAGYLSVDVSGLRPGGAAGSPRRPAISALIFQINSFDGRLSIIMTNAPGTMSVPQRDQVLNRISEMIHQEAQG